MSRLVKIVSCFLAIFVLIGLACSFSKPSDPTATPETITIQEPVVPPVQPTQQIGEPSIPITQPTTEPFIMPTNPPIVLPSEEPISTGSEPFYTEEFDQVPNNWSYFLMEGSDKNMDVFVENGSLVFDLRGEYQWVYYLYEDYIYEDVYIEAVAESRGMNNNNVSLICRYTPDEGWYEFNISNNGLYYIYAYSALNESYNTLFNGGSTAVNMGKSVNVYSAICEGNELTLFINGKQERTIVDNTYKFREGQVGVSVSSFKTLPILVEFDYVYIDQP